jgi:hypothetical protein
MRATLNIPDDLMAEVQNATGSKSKTKAIVTAMEEFVRRKRIQALIGLRGKIEIDDVTEEIERLEVEEMEDDDKRWRDR